MTSPAKTVKVLVESEKSLPPQAELDDVQFWREIRQGLLSINATIERRIQQLKQK